MDYLQAAVLAVVEGVTEFLPISSTGHLVLTADLLNIPQTAFVKSFEIAIQLGAILSVVAIYGRTLVQSPQVIGKMLAGFVPTAAIGFLLFPFIKDTLLGNTMITLLALFGGGVALLLLEKLYRPDPNAQVRVKDISYKKAFLIGVFQSISIVPGVSRAAATIFGGLFLGLTRKTAAEFSFLLAIPTMAGATGLDLLKSRVQFTGDNYTVLAFGFIIAFISAFIAVRYFIRYLERHTFVPFGVYRILLALAFWFLLMN